MQHVLLKILLSPLSLLYGFVVGARNTLYQIGLLKSTKFSIPIIGVGNLSMGGSGKTPHVEYIIRLLQPYMNVGTLSRGYMRKTSGYMEVLSGHNVNLTGDEALQYKLKYPNVIVSVAERRAIGIPLMLADHPDLQTIVLDDAFQHLSVTPGLNILITDYKFPYFKDHLLPSGRLREWRASANRADVIIVSKCPETMTQDERQSWLKKIDASPEQTVYFSYYAYGNPYAMYEPSKRIELTEDIHAVVISGIAKPVYLQEYLESKINFVNMHAYEDHHDFKPHEVSLVHRAIQELPENSIVITTEKDSTRLNNHRDFLLEKKIPVYILPIQVRFHDFNEKKFDDYIKDFLLNFTA